MASSSTLSQDRHPFRSLFALDDHECDLDTDGDDTDVAATPHGDLWFADGSVILATKDVEFRVHMSLLTRHSVFFRDMFSLPQPTALNGGSSFIEGCPVVRLHDSSEDLTNLLLALYDGPYVDNKTLTLKQAC